MSNKPNEVDAPLDAPESKTGQALRDAIDNRIKRIVAEHEAKYHGIPLPNDGKT